MNPGFHLNGGTTFDGETVIEYRHTAAEETAINERLKALGYVA